MTYAEITASVISLLVSQQQVPHLPVKEVNCLAEAIYYEAGGENRRGQLLVADVVMNRVANPRFPKTVCGVVNQPGQFTYKRRPLAAKARSQFRRIAELAARVYAGEHPRLSKATFFYNAKLVKPAWSRTLRVVAQNGPHIFMTARS